MKILNYILLTLFTINVSFAQNSVKRADQYYDKFDFQNALELYKVAEKNNADNIYIMEQMGNCYKFLNQLQDAEVYYEKVVKANESDPIYTFYYAQSLMSNGKYEDALTELNDYYSKVDTEKILPNEFPEILLKENYNYKIKIEDFNSDDDDFSPYKIENEVFFISNRNVDALVLKEDVWSGKYFTQLYHVNQLDTTNSTAEIFNSNSISKKFHEGPIAFDSTSNELYFTRSNYENTKPIKGSDDAVNLKILKVPFSLEDVKGENFNASLEIKNNLIFSSDDYSVAYPAISKDGKTLIFASDMPGGFGGLDLYVSKKVGEDWTNPKNLGETINTVGNEAYPFISKTGDLYFSSDGLLGLGSYDIFKTSADENGVYETPENLRSPINSSYNDFGIWLDNEDAFGYFSSNRPADFDASNIYSFTHSSYSFNALVYDSKSKEVLEDVEVVLTDLDNGDEFVMLTDENGKVDQEIIPFTNYKVVISKDGYFSEEAEFKTEENDVQAEIPLRSTTEINVDVSVLEDKTFKEVPYANLDVYDINTEDKDSYQTNMFGKAVVSLDPGKEYRIIAGKDLPDSDSVYISVSQDINTESMVGVNNIESNLVLSKECTGCEIIIEDILYDLDESYIRPDAAIILDKLVKVLRDNPSMRIELASHTDCRASEEYNLSLSSRRAQAAVDYLINNGISASRLYAKGYGESKPLEVPGFPGLYCSCENDNGPGATNPNCTEEMHQLNRRTSFTILK